MKTSDVDAVTRSLAPGTEAVDKISPAAWSELSENIAATTAESTASPSEGRVITLEKRRQPRSLILVAAASLLVAGVIGATVVQQPGDDRPQALSFNEQGGKVIVRVVDPNADPKRYNADFKAMGLNITVKAVPVSPPKVGKWSSHAVWKSSDMDKLRLLEPGEKCSGTLNASDPGCQDGLEVDRSIEGKVEIDFGRAAKAGEMYSHMSSSATEKGEAMEGMKVRNRTVAEVLPEIEAKGLKVNHYLTGNQPQLDSSESAPGNWYVHDASPYAPGEVTLYVGPTKEK